MSRQKVNRRKLSIGLEPHSLRVSCLAVARPHLCSVYRTGQYKYDSLLRSTMNGGLF